MQVRVYYENTDIGGVVYYANYLKFCERARSEMFFERGVSPIIEGGAFVVKSLKAEYIKSARFGDILDVETKLSELKGASALLSQKIYRDGEPLFECDVKLVFLKDAKPSKIPKAALDILTLNRS